MYFAEVKAWNLIKTIYLTDLPVTAVKSSMWFHSNYNKQVSYDNHGTHRLVNLFLFYFFQMQILVIGLLSPVYSVAFD